MASTPRNPFNPPLAEGVRRFGFRKWYERELLSSHAHLVLAVLSCIALIGTLEVFRDGTHAQKFMNVLMFLASAIIGIWALRRYLYLLMHAEEVANQASCPACEAYARLNVIGEEPRSGEISVRCRQCGHEWRIGP